MTRQPRYVLVNNQGSRNDTSSGRGIGTGVAIGTVGVLLYFLIKNLGTGAKGEGEGRGEGRGDQPSPTTPPTSPTPTTPSPTVSPPPSTVPPRPKRPKDDERLIFVMSSRGIQLLGKGPGPDSYSVEEMIARIKRGKRSDVTLKVTGGAHHGDAESALALLKKAGIEVWRDDGAGAARVSGNARGQYGGRWSAT